MDDIDSEWELFLKTDNCEENNNDKSISHIRQPYEKTPKSGELYISTKSVILYLNTTFDLNNIFWVIPLIKYNDMNEGIIKKQMKFNSSSQDEVDFIQSKIKDAPFYTEVYNIKHQEKQTKTAYIYKDTRKVSMGLSRKDILSYRSKPKSAFYNCFVIILRIKKEDDFHEIHVKVFNTGKMEIPGIQNDKILNMVMDKVKNLLRNITNNNNIDYHEDSSETVLINSNFNCGYLINREKLYSLLKYKYKINSTYDPCSYPGIQCKYKITLDNIEYSMSFMIFRTGSILIVGKCSEEVIYNIYEKLKTIMYNEYENIFQVGEIQQATKEKKIKSRKKKIYVSQITNNNF